MRHHKFRCWDTETLTMCLVVRTELRSYTSTSVLGSAIPMNGDIKSTVYFGKNDLGNEFIPKPKDVMQCTGMIDEAGYELYEKDIVSRLCLDTNCARRHVGIIIFNSIWGQFQIKELEIDENWAKNCHPPLMHGTIDPIVIAPVTRLGNIYENPELLKE